jgi:hypothetical protein
VNFYKSVGQGISHWATMEGRLVQITAILLDTSEDKAGLVMYSIINFHTWLQIVDDLFTLDGTYPNSLKLWRAVLKSLKAENDVRARLAHHAISQDEEKIGSRTGTQAYLRPARLDLRTKSKKAKPLTMVEILEFIGRVGNIHDKLLVLLQQMKKPQSSR